MAEIRRVGVVGAGLMGSGIAEVCARAGLDVVVSEANPTAMEAGRERIAKSLARGVRSGKLSEADRDAALGRLRFTTDLGDFAQVNEVMAGYFQEPYPARATVGVAALPRGARIEIDAVMVSA